MDRNKFGINVDEGVALSSEQEFQLLYIEPDFDAKNILQNWLSNGDKPALLGGQIGCGKTTLIDYSFYQSQIKPDLTFYFDKESLNLSPIDSWSIIFSELFRYIAKHQLIHLIEVPADIKIILGNESQEWLDSISKIRLEFFSSQSIIKNKIFNQQLEEIQRFLPKLFEKLVHCIEHHKGSKIFIFASGVDKFEPDTTAYFSLSEILQSLSKYKTLFEVNAVHLFWNDPWMQNTQRIFIPASKDGWVEQMLEKRLGAYADNYKQEIPLIAKFSGGIPRQALRLLDSFLAEKKNTKANAFLQAIEKVNCDFFAFAQRPENALLRSIQKSRLLETSYISLPGDNETARRAIFGNWVILHSQQHESKWNTVLNPIIKDSLSQILSESPEALLLKKYAEQKGISETGLDINISRLNWQEELITHIEAPLELNITEILGILSSALLSKQRADRVIIAYENKQTADIVRAYLEAKSNSYEYQVWLHSPISYKDNNSILHQLIEHISKQNIDIFSFEFNDEFPIDQLQELNLRRDYFADKQMIWWIQKDQLSNYLSKWTQLRQLFQVFILEEDLLRSLSIEEIDNDLAFMRELADEENTSEYSYVKNLESVLEYLKVVKHG